MMQPCHCICYIGGAEHFINKVLVILLVLYFGENTYTIFYVSESEVDESLSVHVNFQLQ